jgi:hypothetical protein
MHLVFMEETIIVLNAWKKSAFSTFSNSIQNKTFNFSLKGSFSENDQPKLINDVYFLLWRISSKNLFLWKTIQVQDSVSWCWPHPTHKPSCNVKWRLELKVKVRRWEDAKKLKLEKINHTFFIIIQKIRWNVTKKFILFKYPLILCRSPGFNRHT